MSGIIGVDFSDPNPPWKNIANAAAGITPGAQVQFVGLSAYKPVAGLNASLVSNIQSAQEHLPGIPLQLYHFPTTDMETYPQRTPAKQVATVLGAVADLLDPKQITYWIDVEPYGGVWQGGTEDNIGVIQALIDALAGKVRKVGIYTNSTYWKAITQDASSFSTLPLWWTETGPSANAGPNFDGFVPFGGWKQPTMRQYRIEVPVFHVDLDWCPVLP